VLAAGLVTPRVVRHDAAHAEVALLATTATLLGGDTLRLVVQVGPGLRLDLRDVAGTVAYHGRGLGCVVDVALRVHAGATLTWAGEPLVVADGSAVTRHLRADVAEGGRLLLRDRVALGRSGQDGGRLDCHTTLAYAGRPALVEHLELRAGLGPGALGTARVVDTLTALGWRPGAMAGHAAYRLHEPGSVARELLDEAHASGLPAVWAAWGAELLALPPI
jgi:urease accessory protein